MFEFDYVETQELLKAWVAAEGLMLLRNFVVFVLILVVGWVLSRFARRAMNAALERSHLQPSPLLRQFAVNVASKSTLLFALIIALGNLGIDTSALIAGLGVSGLVLGFALKDTLSNFASGILILLYQPFDVGHFVEVSGTMGTVRDMTLVSTILTTPDNKIVNFPNSAVWGSPITNFSASGTRRIDLVVGVAYDTDMDHARRVFLDLLDENEMILEDPEPVVMIGELNNSSIDFFVRGWVETPNFFAARSELLRHIVYRLDEEGIVIPFPQRDVWMRNESDEPAV
jgi:small conductance mechanosensitive channel